MRFYEPPEDVAGTVFDPSSETFGPIMAAMQVGDFEQARALMEHLPSPSDPATGDWLAVYYTGDGPSVDGPFARQSSALHSIICHYMREDGMSEAEAMARYAESGDEWVTRLQDAAPEGLRTVIFRWSTEHGECYDCGNPAAFTSDEHSSHPENLRCSVHAANDAAGGATIERIDGDDA